MKKLISVILSAAILFAFAPLALASGTGLYVVANEVTSVFATPGIAGQKIAELTKNTVVDVTEIRNGKNIFIIEGKRPVIMGTIE